VLACDEGPDDDETAFATASGYWLLVCPSWDVVDAYTLQAEEEQGTRLDEAESFAARFLQQTSAQSAFTLASNSNTTFTVTVYGATLGASVLVTPPTDPTLNTITLYARVTATGTVTVYIGNANSIQRWRFRRGRLANYCHQQGVSHEHGSGITHADGAGKRHDERGTAGNTIERFDGATGRVCLVVRQRRRGETHGGIRRDDDGRDRIGHRNGGIRQTHGCAHGGMGQRQRADRNQGVGNGDERMPRRRRLRNQAGHFRWTL
jgi:hypothetical protein